MNKVLRFDKDWLGFIIPAVILIAFVLVGAASAGYEPGAGFIPFAQPTVEGCPDGYVCLTKAEYAELVADAESCELLPTWTPTATEPPEETPTPPPEVTPTPQDKEKCNRGIGNLEEGCDPGNSYGQGQGEARPAGEDRDEAEGAPPPRRGGGKP